MKHSTKLHIFSFLSIVIGCGLLAWLYHPYSFGVSIISFLTGVISTCFTAEANKW